MTFLAAFYTGDFLNKIILKIKRKVSNRVLLRNVNVDNHGQSDQRNLLILIYLEDFERYDGGITH